MTATLVAPAAQRLMASPAGVAAARPMALVERTLGMLLWLQSAPAATHAALQERRRNAAGPGVIIFLVAVVVLLALAATISLAVLYYCANKGLNFEWYVKTSWFEVKVACSK